MTRTDLPRPSWGWQDAGACRGKDLVLFFGPDGERQPERDIRERKAKQVCMGCPVRTECLDYAVSLPERYGTWGGLNEDERASERRRRLRQATAPWTTPRTRPNGKITYGTGRCQVCERSNELRRDGLLQSHARPGATVRCDGSGELPAGVTADLKAAG